MEVIGDLGERSFSGILGMKTCLRWGSRKIAERCIGTVAINNSFKEFCCEGMQRDRQYVEGSVMGGFSF